MAVEHKLSIFRGRLTFKSVTQKIWGVLIFLSIVTIVEVVLGIFKPQVLMNTFLGMKLLNWIFIILTIRPIRPVSGAPSPFRTRRKAVFFEIIYKIGVRNHT